MVKRIVLYVMLTMPIMAQGQSWIMGSAGNGTMPTGLTLYNTLVNDNDFIASFGNYLAGVIPAPPTVTWQMFADSMDANGWPVITIPVGTNEAYSISQTVVDSTITKKLDTAFVADDSVSFTRLNGDSLPVWKMRYSPNKVFRTTLDANDTLSVSGMRNGEVYTLQLTNAGTYTLFFNNASFDTTPTITAIANKRDFLTFIKVGNIISCTYRQGYP
jgi:hypothetical protein